MKIDLKKRCKLFIVEIIFTENCWNYKEGDIVHSIIVALNAKEAEYKAFNILFDDSCWRCCNVHKVTEPDKYITNSLLRQNIIK